MTLFECIHELLEIAESQPNIHTLVTNDIYQLDAMPNVKYSVFGVTQNAHRQDDDTVYYSLNLYYIDRLTVDDHNELQIQSTGLQVLANIISTFIDETNAELYNENIEYHTFTQKFCDLTAGAYATLTFSFPSVLECYEEY